MNIVLCGFMGSGKSTVGQRLAAETGLSFVDMDRYITQEAHMSVSDIFTQEGEDGFRKREHDACVALGRQDRLVIATGGGAVIREDNTAALKQNGTVVWLRVTPETVMTRLQGDNSRPLLQDNKNSVIMELMAQRVAVYAHVADITVDADGDADAVVQAVLKALAAR